jgi:hypothetical protein
MKEHGMTNPDCGSLESILASSQDRQKAEEGYKRVNTSSTK